MGTFNSRLRKVHAPIAGVARRSHGADASILAREDPARPNTSSPFCAVRPRRELFKLFWIPDLDNPFKRTQLVTNTPE